MLWIFLGREKLLSTAPPGQGALRDAKNRRLAGDWLPRGGREAGSALRRRFGGFAQRSLFGVQVMRLGAHDLERPRFHNLLNPKSDDQNNFKKEKRNIFDVARARVLGAWSHKEPLEISVGCSSLRSVVVGPLNSVGWT